MSTQTHIPLAPQDREAEHRWRENLAQLWKNSTDDTRTTYDRYIAQTPLATGVEFEEELDGDVRGWWCKPAAASAAHALLYLHGGAYALGTAFEFRRMGSQLAARTGVNVLVLDYPRAPETKFPVAHDLAIGTARWLAQRGVERLALAGDSAGGALALASTARLFGSSSAPAIVGCVAFSPWTDLTLSGDTANFADPVLNANTLRACAAQYIGDESLGDPRASPLFGIPSKMPPILIQVGIDELLLDDSRRYAALCPGAHLEEWEGMHHVFQLAVDDLDSARQALERAGEFLSARFAA